MSLENGKSADARALDKAREDVEAMTAAAASELAEGSGAGSKKRSAPIGPMLPPGLGNSSSRNDSDNDDDDTLPGPSRAPKNQNSTTRMSEADRQYALEAHTEALHLSRSTRAPRDNSEREVYAGKEKMVENKRARRESDKSYREGRGERDDADGEVLREDVLMGSGGSDSFRAQLSRFLSFCFYHLVVDF